MLPFNTSAFTNTLGAPDRAAQRKAVFAPFNEFDAKLENIQQHVAQFTQRREETGLKEDFSFFDSEYAPPPDIDLSNPIEKAAWISDLQRLNYGNILLDASIATMKKIQATHDSIHSNLKKFSSPLDPIKMPLASKQLVSFQNCQWIYVLLMSIWSASMKAIMLSFQELHDQDGIILWYCFLQHFAGTTIKNLIEAYSQLYETKIQLSLFQDNVLLFTNAICNLIHHILKANQVQNFQHFLTAFHGCLDASSEEFWADVISLYSDYRSGGPTYSLSMLELLDKLDGEYNHINNYAQILALTSTISSLQTQLTTLKGQYGTLQAFVSKGKLPTPPDSSTKLQKPPPKMAGDPEITKYKGFTWK
jgi:hypothetical protein